MKRTLVPLLLLWLALLTLSACDRGVDLGPPEDTKLNELSDAEEAEACDNFLEYYDDEISAEERQRASCTFIGILAAAFSGATTDAELQSACAAARDECVMEPVNSESDLSCNFKDFTCDATVGELEVCLEAEVEQQARFYDGLQCDTLTLETMESTMDEEGEETIPECEPIYSKCS